MKNNIITKNINKFGLKIKQHGPEILIVSGIIGVAASTVLACKATIKAKEVLDEAKENINKIHECASNEHIKCSGEYTEEDMKKDLTTVYVQTGVKLIRNYAPAVILGTLSLSAIITSNNILRQRNVTLAAAYATLDKSFKEYRKRVIERVGEEAEKEIRYNVKAKTIEETIVDENGKEKKVKKEIKVIGKNYSQFAKFFDESSKEWEKDPEYNLVFLRQQQAWANDKLRAKGYLFLNEVYDMLGLQPTKAGQMYGWIYDPDNPNHSGDNFVDFGIYDGHREVVRDFVNGYERSILLDFNVDGYILDKLNNIEEV